MRTNKARVPTCLQKSTTAPKSCGCQSMHRHLQFLAENRLDSKVKIFKKTNKETITIFTNSLHLMLRNKVWKKV